MNSGDVIQLHVGQAGIQLGAACWEVYCVEHGINFDGTLSSPEASNNMKSNAFYNFTSCGNVVPRVVMVDSEPFVLDEIKAGPFNRLFKCNTLISGKEDSGSNYARGCNSVADEVLDQTIEALRKVAEECNRLDGFFLLRSMGGGTGAGLGTKILEALSDSYGSKTSRLNFAVYPSPRMSPLVVEPLNAALAMHGATDLTDTNFVISNEAIYNIFHKKLFVGESPTFENINQIIAQTISSITAGMRFSSPSPMRIHEFQTNLVPFPRIAYTVCSYAPLVSVKRACSESLTAHKIATEALDRDNTLADVNLSDGLLMARALLYRGNVTTAEVGQEAQYVKAKNPRVSWSPSPIKTALIYSPPPHLPCGDLVQTSRALCVCSNSTAIRHYFADILVKYKILMKKRAFLFHYFGEGLEESQIIDASDGLCTLISEYEKYDVHRYDRGAAPDDIMIKKS